MGVRMFILPGILGLVFLIFIRPFEFIDALQGIPMLYMAFLLAVFGYAVDVRLGFSDVRPAPQLAWAVFFFLWCAITGAVKAPGMMLDPTIQLMVAMTLFYLVAHGVRTFRMFEILAAGVLACSLFVCAVCVHQGMADTQCIALAPHEHYMAPGEPDGRACTQVETCYGPSAEPGYSYRCDHVGLLGTTSIGDRVRYLGVLQDPNEVSLVVAAALPIAFAFHQTRRSKKTLLLLLLAVLLVAGTVVFSKSRGGQLVFLSVIGIYFLVKYGWKGGMLAGVGALPVLVLASGGRGDADASSLERLGCWYAGSAMFKADPVFGVGFGQFTEHHFLTAHNSYVLAAGELGLIGMVIWTSIMWLSVKIPFTAMLDLKNIPGAEVARAWSVALLASLVGVCVGVFFLSFNYHYILWLFVGLTGAFYMAVKGHLPVWKVPFGWKDVAAVTIGTVSLIFVIYMYTRTKV